MLLFFFDPLLLLLPMAVTAEDEFEMRMVLIVVLVASGYRRFLGFASADFMPGNSCCLCEIAKNSEFRISAKHVALRLFVRVRQLVRFFFHWTIKMTSTF